MTGELVLSLEHISKYYGARLVLDDVSFALRRGERVALVGENGAGKTTLARLSLGIKSADEGNVWLVPQAIVGYLPQEVTVSPALMVADYIAQAVGDLHALETRMDALAQAMAEGATDDATLEAYGMYQEQFMARGGYTLASRTAEVFAGLQIGYLASHHPMNALSGGEKTRVHLASLLLQAPDLLILDEPTNHLDRHGVAWLEAHLAHYPHAVLVITHDRTFIDSVATGIAELSPITHALSFYVGSYEDYLQQRERAHEKALTTFLTHRKEVQRLRRAIKTETYNARTPVIPKTNDGMLLGKMARTAQQTRQRKIQSAKQRLERLEEQKPDKLSRLWRLEFGFNPLPMATQEPLRLEALTFAYDERVILHDTSATVMRGERVALVGANGAGKSTLLRLLSGLLMPHRGRVVVASGVKLGYLDQEGETLAFNQTVWEAYQSAATIPPTEAQALAELHRCGLFSHATLLQQSVRALSVGQARKLGIARLIASQANALILDEPTNHLDFVSLEALESALVESGVTLIAATHDRRFIANVATQVWRLHAGKIIIDA